jgi:hypothetical protein
MTFKARVFLDTTVVQHSTRARTVLSPRRASLNVGGRLHEVVVKEIVSIDPAASVQDPALRAEIDLLSAVARRARAGEIELLWHIESEIEFFGSHKVDGGASELLDAGVTMVDGPVKYSRQVIPSPLSGDTWRSLTTDFMRRMNHPRFLELQRACGAFQGDRVHERQLADAFHVWCAEVAGASHFLTNDFKLIRHVRDHKAAPPRVRVVAPSELLAELEPT